jgi:hypothetical protein
MLLTSIYWGDVLNDMSTRSLNAHTFGPIEFSAADMPRDTRAALGLDEDALTIMLRGAGVELRARLSPEQTLAMAIVLAKCGIDAGADVLQALGKLDGEALDWAAPLLKGLSPSRAADLSSLIARGTA